MIRKFRYRPLVVEAVQFDGSETSARTAIEGLKLPGGRFKPIACGAGLIMSSDTDPPLTVLPGEFVVKYDSDSFIAVTEKRFQKIAEPA